jgi:hypothetical protein
LYPKVGAEISPALRAFARLVPPIAPELQRPEDRTRRRLPLPRRAGVSVAADLVPARDEKQELGRPPWRGRRWGLSPRGHLLADAANERLVSLESEYARSGNDSVVLMNRGPRARRARKARQP